MADNATFPSYHTCTEITDICAVEYTVYGALFTKAACIFFAASYLLLLAAQLVLGIKSRTWSFTTWLVLGTGFELIGYAARTVMADNPWKINAFIAQYLTLLLGPTLIAAAVSITFKHLVIWYGAEWSVLRPRLYPFVFVGMDLLSIAVQILGGGIMTANTTGDGGSEGSRKLAEALLIGGVAFQVANMLFCGALMLVYYRRRKRSHGLKRAHTRLGSSEGLEENNLMPGKGYFTSHQGPEAGRVRIFVLAVLVAYVAIVIRCSYRIFEMIPAFAKDVARNETLFLVFDGAMIILAVGCVTIFHPCIFFPFMGKGGNKKVGVPQTHLEPVSHQPSRPYEPLGPYGGPVASHPYGRPDAYELGRIP